MKKILASFFSFFKKNNNPQTKQEDVKPEKIINQNGRLFFKLPFSSLGFNKIRSGEDFYTSVSASEMLYKLDLFMAGGSEYRVYYNMVLIPITEIVNPEERRTKRFMELAIQDYGQQSVNRVCGELGPLIANFLSPKDLKENGIDTIVIPSQVIADFEENCIFLIERRDDIKNFLTSWESIGYRAESNLWKEGKIYLAFVVSVEKNEEK